MLLGLWNAARQTGVRGAKGAFDTKNGTSAGAEHGSACKLRGVGCAVSLRSNQRSTRLWQLRRPSGHLCCGESVRGECATRARVGGICRAKNV